MQFRKIIQHFFCLIFIVSLAGCSHVKSLIDSDGMGAVKKPQPLSKVVPKMLVKTTWQVKVGGVGRTEYLQLHPVQAGKAVFVPSYDGKVTAFALTSGSKLWQIDAGVSLTTGLSANDNLLFIGDNKGEVLALRQSDGRIMWRASLTGEILATPSVADNKVIAQTESGEVFSFAARDGSMLWSYTHQQPSLVLRGSSSPVIYGNFVLAGFADGVLVALSLDSGQLIWQQVVAESHGESSIERMVDIDSHPLVANGVIYVATYQGKIAALNLRTGNTIWSHDFSSYADLALGDKYVYATDVDGVVSAFGRESGNVIWQQKALTDRNVTGPAVIGNFVVVADQDGDVHWLDQQSGAFVARNHVSGGALVSALVVGNSVLVLTKNGQLSKFDI
jgi:outer membrane protein assembly factor BamB